MTTNSTLCTESRRSVKFSISTDKRESLSTLSSYSYDVPGDKKEQISRQVERLLMKRAMRGFIDNSIHVQTLHDEVNFDRNEIIVGKKVCMGQENFCSVREVRKIIINASLFNDSLSRDRMAFADGCLDHESKSKYVIKSMDSVLIGNDEAYYFSSMLNIATEAHFLSAMTHPNILKIRSKSPKMLDEKTFLIFDRCYETLERRILRWRQIHSKHFDEPTPQKARFWKTSSRHGKVPMEMKEFLKSRIEIAMQLCSAMHHLHSNRVMHRDIKPSSMGFKNSDPGELLLFGFGLATSFGQCDGPLDSYKYTAQIGTLRYMAPEVYRAQPYNETIDIYSLGISLWQIFSLQKPFDDLRDARSFKKSVFIERKRPSLRKLNWIPHAISELITKCWSDDPVIRPNAQSVYTKLYQALNNLSSNGKYALVNSKRRYKQRLLDNVELRGKVDKPFKDLISKIRLGPVVTPSEPDKSFYQSDNSLAKLTDDESVSSGNAFKACLNRNIDDFSDENSMSDGSHGFFFNDCDDDDSSFQSASMSDTEIDASGNCYYDAMMPPCELSEDEHADTFAEYNRIFGSTNLQVTKLFRR